MKKTDMLRRGLASPAFWVFLIAATCLATSAPAALIASESFATPTGYDNDTNLNLAPHNSNVVGNVGFSADRIWIHGTGHVRPRSTGYSLTHILVTGSATDGGIRTRATTGNDERRSVRQLAETPAGTSFFMSALLSTAGDLANAGVAGTICSIGLVGEAGDNETNSWSGFHIGTYVAADGVYLAAIAGGNVHTLGSALTTGQASGAHQVVLQLTIGGAGPNDTLRAWVAMAGAEEHTFSGEWTGLDTAASGADVGWLALQTQSPGESIPGGIAIDEWRFGSTFAAVAIPEPMHAGLWAIGAACLWLIRRRRA